MNRGRYYVHGAIILLALIIGGLSLFQTGVWMDGRDNVPNFIAVAMVLLVISQVILIRAGRKGKNK